MNLFWRGNPQTFSLCAALNQSMFRKEEIMIEKYFYEENSRKFESTFSIRIPLTRIYDSNAKMKLVRHRILILRMIRIAVR